MVILLLSPCLFDWVPVPCPSSPSFFTVLGSSQFQSSCPASPNISHSVFHFRPCPYLTPHASLFLLPLLHLVQNLFLLYFSQANYSSSCAPIGIALEIEPRQSHLSFLGSNAWPLAANNNNCRKRRPTWPLQPRLQHASNNLTAKL